LAKKIAALCDVYVNDAFGTAHRAEATTHGVARFAKVACAGPLMAAELEALGKALGNPARPLVAIVAGSKVSTKLTILDALAKKVDSLIVGGGIANSFLLAEGTETLARAIAKSKAYTIAGGGDTVAAINKFGIAEDIDYISTAGGAFLEFLEGKTLPAVAALEARADG